uniref:Uncharacterized protein n=1 Tax=Anguilla anguilla TaxID=7936 RepID=A0A0E9P5U1_ANGAN
MGERRRISSAATQWQHHCKHRHITLSVAVG